MLQDDARTASETRGGTGRAGQFIIREPQLRNVYVDIASEAEHGWYPLLSRGRVVVMIMCVWRTGGKCTHGCTVKN